MKEKNYYAQIFFVALFLLSFMFFNIFISSTLFIFKISINEVTVIASFILSILLNGYLGIKKKLLCKDKLLKNILLIIILPIILIFASLYINGKVLDYTWDGNSYQKATTGMLATRLESAI